MTARRKRIDSRSPGADFCAVAASRRTWRAAACRQTLPEWGLQRALEGLRHLKELPGQVTASQDRWQERGASAYGRWRRCFGFGKNKGEQDKAATVGNLPAAPVAAKPVAIPRGPMTGLMQDWKLTVDKVIEHARLNHGARDRDRGPSRGRSSGQTYSISIFRARKCSNALLADGVPEGRPGRRRWPGTPPPYRDLVWHDAASAPCCTR